MRIKRTRILEVKKDEKMLLLSRVNGSRRVQEIGRF